MGEKHYTLSYAVLPNDMRKSFNKAPYKSSFRVMPRSPLFAILKCEKVQTRPGWSLIKDLGECKNQDQRK
jgi:hypothetical protein